MPNYAASHRVYHGASHRVYSSSFAVDGFPIQVAGTSASSPTFTGMITLLNDRRLAAGKSSLGWLNPLIYQHPEIFTPVTAGSNPGCNTNGFPAASSWSPVTGLGSLDYAAALKLVMSLP